MKNRLKVNLGSIGKPLGLDGAFFVFGRDELISKSIRTLEVELGSKRMHSAVIRCWWHNSRVVAKLEQLSDRTAVEAWKGAKLSCLRDQLSVDDSSEYLWQDLISKNVIDPKGQLVGKVVRVENYGASDVVEISDGSQRLLAIPLVSSYFDMSFKAGDEFLRLIVSAETFDEAWQ